MFKLVVLALALGVTEARLPRAHELTRDYSYEQFLADSGRDTANPCPKRREVFEANLKNALKHNAKPGVSYTLGINKFSDAPEGPPRGLHGGLLRTHKSQLSAGEKDERTKLPFELKPVEELPESVDWREEGIVSAVKDQGGCGSCWAFATTATMESHIAKETGVLFNFSPQELVSCMPNPDSCGGTGGCAGAIAELAFEFYMTEGGVVQEYQFGYTSYYGEDGECTIEDNARSKSDGPDPDGVVGGVANITGYTVLPANDYSALMNAVATVGPIAISVDAMSWSGYEGGVFQPSEESYENPDIDHAVVLVGYGVDEDSGLPYWLVRNSWSPTWGENGYIRLIRETGEQKCGVDTTPLDGFGCVGGAENITVCGASGMLSDSSFPTGGYLL